MRRFIHLLACLGFFLVGQAIAGERIQVVASFSILGDLVKNVGGDRVLVHTLVGENSDAHVYQPTPTDAKLLARAQLVVVNGFGFEGWIDRLIKSSGYRGKVVVASTGVKTLKRPHTKASRHADHDHEADPHAWQDMSNVILYVDTIEQALSEVDPAGKAIFQGNARQYKREIAMLDQHIRQAFAAIPAERRKIVTSHDAFGYFGRAYGVTFISPVGVNTDAEPSAKEIGRIIQQIKREKIPAVFMESISDPRLLERIRLESGARIGGTLYSDSLSKAGAPAPSYLEMMRHNATTLLSSLNG